MYQHQGRTRAFSACGIRPRLALSAFAQRRQQVPQAVVIDLVHQRELPTDFAAREAFAGQPVEVRPRKIGNESALVLSKGHGDGDEVFKVWGLHAGIVHGFSVLARAGPMRGAPSPRPCGKDAANRLRPFSGLLDWNSPLQTMEGIMLSVYVVKTGEQVLCTAEDGDIGMAPAVEDATSFGSYEEAEKTALVHADPGYEIVAVCVLRH